LYTEWECFIPIYDTETIDRIISEQSNPLQFSRSVPRFTNYLITVAVVIASEMKIIGLALATVGSRARLMTDKQMKVNPSFRADPEPLYLANLKAASASIVAHHHDIKKYLYIYL
jgi:hypothetical protein